MTNDEPRKITNTKRAKRQRKYQRLKSKPEAYAKRLAQQSARNTVQRSLSKGQIVRPNVCQRCGGEGKIEAHHTDYSRPLDVQWLCQSCHRREHGIQ